MKNSTILDGWVTDMLNFIIGKTQSPIKPDKKPTKSSISKPRTGIDPYEEIILNELDGEEIA